MQGYKVLIVEDDESILKHLKNILEDSGAVVTVNRTGENVMEEVAGHHIILMDIMLPYDDGISLSHMVKGSVDIPIIFLTARNDIDSKIKGLTSGEDYITKPFHPLELISRINNLLDRYYKSTVVQCGHLIVDERHEIVMNDQNVEVPFTGTEQKLFFYLYKNKNITLTKAHLMTFIWPEGDVYDNILSVYIKRVRKLTGDTDGKLIQTVHGIGYRMVCNET